MISPFLTFSDTAKFVDLARNFVTSGQWGLHHSFFNKDITLTFNSGDLFVANFYPTVSLMFSFIFKYFPINDLTVIVTGLILYVFSSLLIYRLANKIFSKTIAILSVILFLAQYQLYNYVLNTTTEVIFIFLSLLFINLILSGKKGSAIALLVLPLLFITRQQAIIFLASGVPFVIYSSRSRLSKNSFRNLVFVLAITACSYLIWSVQNQNLKLSLFSSFGAINIPTDIPQGAFLRGLDYPILNSKQVLTKLIYNLYNFAKFPDRIISPVLILLFIYALFLVKTSRQRQYLLFVLVNLFLFTLAASLTLPIARYIHPLLPYLVIGSAYALVCSLNQIRHGRVYLFIVICLILIRPMGQLLLDTRFESKTLNTSKPPAYYVISRVFSDNISKNKLIITNLDSWAAWYFGLTTMWFPVNPDMLIPPEGKRSQIDYIAITNYNENDGDFTLGEWRDVVYHPDKITNQYLLDNYKVLKTFSIDKSLVRENKEVRGTILVRK